MQVRGSQGGPACDMSSMHPGSWTSPWRSCPSRGQCIFGKSRALSAKGKREGLSGRVTVKKNIVQQEMADVQVRNCGCLAGLSDAPQPSPRLLTKTQQCPPYHHSKSKRWHPAPQPPQDSRLLHPQHSPLRSSPRKATQPQRVQDMPPSSLHL